MSTPQLFCFTCAGGTTLFFNEIESDLPEINFKKIEYAGHGVRHKEEFCHNFDELAEDAFRVVKNNLSGNYSLFGYSMGSITAVEVLKRIIRNRLPLPRHLFLAAHEPHTKSELLDFTAEELDEWVKNRTVQFGGIPEKILNNRTFWRVYLPIYRADYTIIGKYDFHKLDLKADIPTTVFYSETDTPFSEMKKWERYFPCDFYQFEGTHFFIHQHHKEMAEVIRKKLRTDE